jgi:sigma-E factor negative regulatory protein RseA
MMKTRISALMDGELEQYEVASTLESLRSTDAVSGEWREFHLIGEALRGEGKLEFDVSTKVMSALADEPTVLAPVRSAVSRGVTWVRPALALAASAAGVAVVAWVGLGSVSPQSDARTAVASYSSPVPPAAEVQRVVASPRMQEYLVAHQTHGSGAALVGGSHYVRTVSMAREGR